MLQNKLSNHHIILASGSPRRQQFLKDLNIDFEIRLKDIEEIYPKHLKTSEITDYLSKLKADAFTNELNNNDILITSDTIVWLNNTALGKPKNYNEAFKMLSNLSANTHKVITSICITSKENQKIINDTTEVTFKTLTDEEINYYIENYQPYDKAGAYGIQEWIGKIGITHIKGSYFNVVGLPVHKLYKELMNF
ncbi:Maf-like protein [Tenacibaculum geojense]|uniref:dTTP/UTP pyrophosphatase n=1 Tax=Tenacibaculum geojense TaxID=915352 RepID=A0ABW3JNX9_9FLAO